MSYVTRLATVILLSLVVAGFAIVPAGSQARGQGVIGEPTPISDVPETVPEEWKAKYATYDKVPMQQKVGVYKRVANATKSPNPVLRNAGGRVMTRAIGSAMGSKLTRAGTKLGYAGTAVGVWTIVYFELKYASELGYQGSIYNPLKISPASSSVAAAGVNHYTGRIGGYAFLDSVDWELRKDRTYTIKMSWRVYAESFEKSGLSDGSCSFSSTTGGLGWQAAPPYGGSLLGFTNRGLSVRTSCNHSFPEYPPSLQKMESTYRLRGDADYYLVEVDESVVRYFPAT